MQIIILAAGLGTRMRSSLPKILHKLFEKPIIDYVIDCAEFLKPKEILVVVNPSLKEVTEHLKKRKVKVVYQYEPKGTADALISAVSCLSEEDDFVILNGDTPLIKPDTIQKLYELFKSETMDLAILSFYIDREHSYGRILRNNSNKVQKIVEITDIDQTKKSIKEANSGIYIMNSKVLKLLNYIKENPHKKEFYLTDIVELAVKRGYKVQAYPLAQEDELVGINTRYELSLAMKYLRDTVVDKFMKNGVTFYDPQLVWIAPSVDIGRDTIIYPYVFLEGNTKIGRNCIIYQGVRIKDSIIDDRVQIKDCTVIEGSYVNSDSQIGPFAHLRPESQIGKECRIGNFVEVKKSIIGNGTKSAHLSYIGDAEVGKNVNIGAGTITCNYDGEKKHKTIIEDNVFIGSDTQLVAPIKVGRGAYIGAGSTITKKVPEDSLAISRTPQKNIEGWAKKRRQKK